MQNTIVNGMRTHAERYLSITQDSIKARKFSNSTLVILLGFAQPKKAFMHL